VYDTKALFGGLLGRTFLIKPNEFRPANSLFEIRDTSESYAVLKQKLLEISKVCGEFEFTAAAQRTYEDWYKPFRKSYEGKADKSGISGRIHTSVIKLAMVLCVNSTRDLLIDEPHVREAISHCMSLLPNYTGFVMSTGKSSTAEVIALLIEDIWNAQKKVLTKSEFLTRHFHMFDLDTVDKGVAQAEQAGLIKCGMDGREITYMTTDKCVQVFGLK
jgi:hypothetical protein